MPTVRIMGHGVAARRGSREQSTTSGPHKRCLRLGRDNFVGHAEALQRTRIFTLDARQYRPYQLEPGKPHVFVHHMQLRSEEMQEPRRLLGHDIDIFAELQSGILEPATMAKVAPPDRRRSRPGGWCA